MKGGFALEFESFFKMNEDRIHFMIHQLGIKGDWYGEFYAEGLVALWQAYKSFDDTKGDIGTYLNYRIRYRMLDLLRKKLRDQEKEEAAVSEMTKRKVSGNRHRATQRELIDPEGIDVTDDAFWQAVKHELSDNEWKWVYYFIICDLSIKEIMEIENVTVDTVKGWARRVRQKLRTERMQTRLHDLID